MTSSTGCLKINQTQLNFYRLVPSFTMYTTSSILTFLALTIVYYVSRQYVAYLHYERTRKSFGCPPLSRYPSWDPVFGIDYVRAMMKALKKDMFLQFQIETYAARGAKVWRANFLGNRMVYSAEPENMKAMSTSHKDAFAVEPIRVGNGAITPFTGPGVSSTDGARWQASRDLVKPYFERAGFSNLERLSGHMDCLIGKIPKDGSTVDMQPLFQRWVCFSQLYGGLVPFKLYSTDQLSSSLTHQPTFSLASQLTHSSTLSETGLDVI